MSKRLQGWASLGVLAAWALVVGPPARALVVGPPARADVVVGAAIWSCQNEGSDQATARLEVTKLSSVDVDEQGVRLSEAAAPFTCSLPWGELQVEVTDYYSPRNNGRCGAAEVWGLRVTAKGQVLQDIPAGSALACHMDTFNPFLGWVEAVAERVVVCQAQRDGSTPDCVTTEPNEF